MCVNFHRVRQKDRFSAVTVARCSADIDSDISGRGGVPFWGKPLPKATLGTLSTIDYMAAE